MNGETGAVVAGLAVGIAFVVLFSMASMPEGRANTDDVVITMERTVCFGTCPAYKVTVYGNGTVMYEGFRFVAVEGRQKVKELVSQFYKHGFFSLKDRYEEQMTDLSSTTTSIAIGASEKSVYRYGLHPENLVELENKIDEIAGTAKWVKRERTPQDFAVKYSYGYGGDYVLDTKSNIFSVLTCNDQQPIQHVALKLSEQELYTIWQSVNENNFFALPDFAKIQTSGMQIGVDPEDRSALQITANDQEHKVGYRQNYELNYGLKGGLSNYKSIEETIKSVLSEYNLPKTGCAHL
jgi:hypothetical protein